MLKLSARDAQTPLINTSRATIGFGSDGTPYRQAGRGGEKHGCVYVSCHFQYEMGAVRSD